MTEQTKDKIAMGIVTACWAIPVLAALVGCVVVIVLMDNHTRIELVLLLFGGLLFVGICEAIQWAFNRVNSRETDKGESNADTSLGA